MKKLLLMLPFVFIFSCEKSGSNSTTPNQNVKTLAFSKVSDFNLDDVPEVSVLKTNLDQQDVIEFDQKNSITTFACNLDMNPVDARVSVGDVSVQQKTSSHLANLNGEKYSEQYKYVITVTDTATSTVTKNREEIDFQTTGSEFNEFEYCGMDDQEKTFVDTPSAIVNVDIDGQSYPGLLYKTSVKGQVYCLKNNVERTRVNLGLGTKEGRQIYFHQLIDLNSYNYHCKNGGQKWFDSATIKLDLNGAIVFTEFNKLIKSVIKD